MDMHQEMDLQLFADAGTLVNAGGNYVNAYTGEKTAFPEGGGMTASMKTFYDTELLENARPELIHTQFARKQVLPAGRGKTVEWRKWNTLEDAGALTEGVIPTGQKFGQSAVTQAVTQYGTYVSVSDQLELHAIDDVILGAAEELGASAWYDAGRWCATWSWPVRTCSTATRSARTARITAVTSRAGLDTTAKLTPDEVNKAVTLLKKLKAPKIDGKYVAIIHPSVAYDLRSSDAWVEAHKYAGSRSCLPARSASCTACASSRRRRPRSSTAMAARSRPRRTSPMARLRSITACTRRCRQGRLRHDRPGGRQHEMIIKRQGLWSADRSTKARRWFLQRAKILYQTAWCVELRRVFRE